MRRARTNALVIIFAIAASTFAINALIACDGDDAPSGSGTDAAAGGSSGSSGGSSGTSGASGNVAADCTPDPFAPVEAACTSLCNSLGARGCTWAESWIPSATFKPKLFSLYVSGPPNGTFDAARCIETCTQVPASKAAEACNVQRAAYVDCLDKKGTCVAHDSYVYLRDDACRTEREAIVTCATDCKLIPVCEPSSCNGSNNAGGVYCTYACRDGYCAQTCN